MPLQGALERYRVEPRSQVKLDEIATDDKSLFHQGGKDDYLSFFDDLRNQLQALQKVLYAQGKHKVLVVIQAMDTGGKDGCVKHVFSRVDPQGIVVNSFKKPTPEELAHDFLWRVHHHTPGSGQLVIFNRSHYEDIIAVRVKKIYGEERWRPRYRHIQEFERMLAEEGTTIVKLFLHISKEEQKERLQARLDEPGKNWKFNPDDLKDRARWDEFMEAYGELISETSTDYAPWYIIPSDRKWYRNLVVSRIMVDTLKRLDLSLPEVDWDAGEINIED